jgi:hypothetical protein
VHPSRVGFDDRKLTRERVTVCQSAQSLTRCLFAVARSVLAQTFDVIPRIVGRLRAKHYHLVTLPRLLAEDPPPDGRRPPKLRTER